VTARLLSLSGSSVSFSLSRLAVAAGRVLFVLFAGYAIYTTRTASRFDAGIVISLGVAVGTYVLFGRRGGLRPIILYIIATGMFTQLRLLADETGIPAQFGYVISMERSIFATIPSFWLQSHLYQTGELSPVTVFAIAVYVTYFASFPIGALIMWIRFRSFFSFFATAMVLASYIGLLVCIVLPTAPPWLASEQGFAPEIHRIAQEATSTGAYGGGAYVAGVNQVAAMPSLHMALTVIAMFTVWRLTRNRWWRAASVLYAGSMAFSLVFLGEHYVVDEIFGVLTAVIAWKAAMRLWSADGKFLPGARSPGRQRPDKQPVPVSLS
jgi:membrane-associated phospholipid phosphatase